MMNLFVGGVLKTFIRLNAKLIAGIVGVAVVTGVGFLTYTSIIASETATLYFDPSASTMPPDQVVTLHIDTQTDEVGFVAVKIDFDQTKLALTDEVTVNPLFTDKVGNGSPFNSTMSESNASGEIYITYGIGGGTPPTGDFYFAEIPLTSLSATDNDVTTLTIDVASTQVVNLVPDEMILDPQVAAITLNPVAPTSTLTPTVSVSPSPSPSVTVSPTPQPGGAHLSIQGPATGFVGETFTTDLDFSTDTEVSGVDALLSFDPSQLQIVSVIPQDVLSSTSISDYDNTLGTLSFSQISDPGIGYFGTGTLAQIEFEALVATSSAALSFDYTPGSTSDSNAVSFATGEDILNQPADYVLSVEEHQELIIQIQTASTNGYATSVDLSSEDGSWTTTLTTDATGLSDPFQLPDSFLGVPLILRAKVDGYLTSTHSFTPSGGTYTADFGVLRAGDLDNNGIVNNLDLTLMYSVWGYNTTDVVANYNKDVTSGGLYPVNSFDYWSLASHFLQTDE